MREIKYRAWDKENKRMVSPDCIYADGSCSYVEEHYQGEQEPGFSRETLTPEGCILLQSTGLFDKNGVEIYENYIVKRDNYLDNELQVVTYWQYEAGYVFVKKMEMVDGAGCGRIGFNEARKCEVIGNIYENPELLN